MFASKLALANLDSSVPLELRTGLDGPKWASPSGARQSQSQATDTPRKPHTRPSEVQEAQLRSSARRLFSESSSSPRSASASASLLSPRHAESGDEDPTVAFFIESYLGLG